MPAKFQCRNNNVLSADLANEHIIFHYGQSSSIVFYENTGRVKNGGIMGNGFHSFCHKALYTLIQNRLIKITALGYLFHTIGLRDNTYQKPVVVQNRPT